METKPIQFLYNINRMEAVNLIATIHIDDYDTRFLEIVPIDDKTPLVIQGATVTARFVTRKNSLLSDNVACTVTDKNTIIIPIDAAAVHSVACDVKIEVNIVNGTDVLTLPFPLWVRVRGSILDNASVTPDTEGTVAELLRQAEEELSRVRGFVTNAETYAILDEAFLGDSAISPQFLIDSTVDQQYNPFGHLMVYYVDSNDVRHNLYDFYTTFINMLKYRVVNSPDDATQIGVLYKTDISVDHDSQTAYVWCYENVSQFTQFAYLMDGHIAWRTRDKQTAWQPASDWGAWREIGGITVQSAAVNQNGTITFTLSDGSVITTTGASVIGPQGPAGANGQDGADGISPTATVTQTATGATITVTDANGTTTANIANGQDYNLTAQDKSDIAALVLAQLPTTQGVQYGNSSN